MKKIFEYGTFANRKYGFSVHGFHGIKKSVFGARVVTVIAVVAHYEYVSFGYLDFGIERKIVGKLTRVFFHRLFDVAFFELYEFVGASVFSVNGYEFLARFFVFVRFEY